MILKVNEMGLKAKIRNIAKVKNISAQVVLQNYFFERFLYRLSKSAYCENFVIKGGLLITALTGINTRTTMDMDVTIRSIPLDEKHLKTVIEEICNIQSDDNIYFNMTNIDQIREDDEYGGFQISINAIYEKINSPLSIDVTAGDVITPKPVKRHFKSIIDEEKICELWTYNIETILAEKIETILRRGESSTRPRDLYDVYIINKTQKFNKDIFYKALSSTAKNRGTEKVIENISDIVNTIKDSKVLKKYWEKYRQEYYYAKDITYEETINNLSELL